MVTGRKSLLLFKSVVMKSGIKFSHFFHKMSSFFENVIGKTLSISFTVCSKSFSDFHHNFAVLSFNNKKWFQKWKKVVHSFSSKSPAINRSVKCFFCSPPVSIFRTSSKMFSKPFNKDYITRSNSNKYMPLLACTIFSLFNVTDVEATFSIDDSSQISYFDRSLSSFKNSFTSHTTPPCVKYGLIINENNNNVQRERLNEKTHFGMRKSELLTKAREEKSKNFSRLGIGHKSNSLVLNAATKRLGQSMRETEDQLIRDMLAGTASVLNCVNGVNGDNPTEITRADVDAVAATLQGNNGDFISSVIEGQDKFGTGPVRDSYFAMCDTDMIGQLENANGFINKAQYPNQANISPSEWGSIGNARFFLSSEGSVTVGGSLLGADIYNIFFAAQESYAMIKQNSVSAKFIYHPPGHGDDPCELRQTAGWRMAQVPRITNDAWMINLRATLV